MRSDVIFDSLYLGRCLRFDWYLDVIMFSLLGEVFFMFRSDLDVTLGHTPSLLRWSIFHWFDSLILSWFPYRASYELVSCAHTFWYHHDSWWSYVVKMETVISRVLLGLLIVFIILSSLCIVFLRLTGGLLMSWR